MKHDLPELKERLAATGAVLKRYAVPLFLLFLLGIYGLLALRVVSLSQAEPDPGTVTTRLKTAGVPNIDPDVLEKIRQLQDNSVDVQTLFDEARNNPFQE